MERATVFLKNYGRIRKISPLISSFLLLAMFLFLSKLLPQIFLYPLGIASMLLVGSLVLIWRKSRWSPAPIALALATILLSSNAWTTNAIIQSLEWQNIPTGDLPKAEAIILLGGATRSKSYPRTGVDLGERSDRIVYAAQLYKQGKAPLIIISGGRIDWKDYGDPESSDMAAVLVNDLGVPPTALIEEPDSLNTYENAINVQKIMATRNIKRVLLVTSAFHMPRSLRIFRKLKMEVIPAPSDYLASRLALAEPGRNWEAAILSAIPDTERINNFTVALKEYIGTWIYTVKGWA
jgi:uncharacterized SAM-binding protein YcdF (DUF218 family)